MKKIIFLITVLPITLYSQDWIDKMQNPNINFYETQQDFEEYWRNKPIEKGKGWKQFKRWENFMIPRVFPSGEYNPNILIDEYKNLTETNNQFLMSPPNIWEQVGPDNVPLQSNGDKRGIGRVNTVAFHPTNPNIIYVGAPAGGFWKSSNNGQTWSTTTDFLTNLGVSDIAINPNNANEIYIITGDRDAGDTYSYGLMKSIDGGNSFNLTGLSFNITNYYKGNRVLIDPTNTNVIIVATSNGIYRSVDSGVTFVLTYSGINMTDIEFHPTNPDIIYGASKGNTSIYKSSDNGISWSQAGSGLPSTNSVVRACVAVTPDNPQVVYAMFGNNSNGFYGVYKSSDEGLTWSQQSNSPNLLGWSATGSDNDGQAWYDLAFAVSPTNEDILFVGGINCWKSTNSGQSWNINTHWYGANGITYMHADEHMLKYNPLNNYLYSGNDGGLYYSNDNGNDWMDISDGLHITQFYSLGVSQTVQDKVITGSQDNGTFLKSNLNWDAVIGGDGMECIIDYTNSNIMYGSLYYGDIRKSTNGGNSFSSIAPANNGSWETPYILDMNDPNIIYIGYDEIKKSIDGGNNWTQITNGETNGGKINEIAISKSNPNVIYFTDDSNIFKTTDGGNNWIQVNNNLPYLYISYVIINPNDENTVWVTFSGYSSGKKVYKSIDGGNSWVNISGTLPNVPINCIELDKNNNLETLYIGSDLGVFTSDSTLNDWNLFNNNTLPNVIVNELEIQYQSNKLFAATYGRGLWSIDLEITSPPSANFSFSDSIFCNIPATVNFLNNSYYSNSYYWDFGDGNTSISTNPTHTYNSFGTYSVKLIANGPLGSDSIIMQQIISINQNNYCITTLPVSGAGNIQTQCNGTLYDVGGPNGNYYDMNDCWVTIAPPGSNQITLTFNSFDIEAPSSSSYCNWDYLEIFDGPDTASTSLGQFCNALTGSPGIVTSSGGAITVFLHSDQAVNGTGFEADWSCIFPTNPPSSMFDISDSISCSSTVSFTDLSTNGPTTWYWDFGDGNSSNNQNPTHTYSSSGIFNIKLITSNQYGTDTLIIDSAVTILNMNLQTINALSCGPSSFLLNASSTSGLINWYDDINLQNQVATGTTFMTPLLNNTTSYYAQAIYEFSSIFGAPSTNSFGSGGYYQGNRHLIFDNYTPSILISVLVYANSDGFRTIELRNSSNAILQDTTIFVPYSPNGVRIYLNFNLPVENNMQLGILGTDNDMYRNSSGAAFPYNINDIVSITGTNAPIEYYYFFYDWEVKKQSCSSNISVVQATIENNSTNTTYMSTCGSYLWPVNGQTYNSTGIYIDSAISISGCIHTEILNLTIDNNSTNTESVVACDSYYWPVDGQIYNTTGIYTNVITNPSGCIQTEILDLNINYSETTYEEITFCNGDSIIINGNIYYNPGLYTDQYLTVNGCDSIVQTMISVLPTVSNNQNIVLCEGDSIQIGTNIYTSSGLFIDTTTGINNCDSIIYSNIELSNIQIEIILNNNQLTTNIINGIANNYIWNNGQTGSSIQIDSSGMYWCLVTDVNGCISDTAFYNYTVNSTNNFLSNSLYIFPNPTSGIINISLINNSKTKLSITNLLGEKIYESIINKKGNINQKINISNFANGIYIIHLSTNTEIVIKKIILE